MGASVLCSPDGTSVDVMSSNRELAGVTPLVDTFLTTAVIGQTVFSC